ncbi:hypothetical protein RJ639_031904 [Escallonia herrerae]|uniref:Uncharacterized protein n=1 Tax=Escallonia herrerae TaxID=1293975 RepID=A0AA88X636_9ASTE|nr:hypothetical protein RJ639_031904 [Escallonia herrerae]
MEGAGAEAEALVPAAPAGAPLIRRLASCNKPTRDKALRLLNTWLPSQLEVSDEDMKKVWKGLFYCLWHADKAPAQSDLIGRLSSLLLALHPHNSANYLSAFLLTMRREWPGIDSHRLDKFYLLIRRFLSSLFRLFKNNDWDLELTRTLMNLFEDKAFFADDNLLGNGVNYHIASVFLDELKPFLPARTESLDVLFKPFLAVTCKSQDKVLVSKVRSNVFDAMLEMGKSLLKSGSTNGCDVGDEALNVGTITLTLGFAGKLYELGSSPDCFQANRKVLFGLHGEFLKLEKNLELSGIEIPVPTVKVDDADEVPMLIPIDTNETQVGVMMVDTAAQSLSISATSESSKKKKKGKKGSHGSKKRPTVGKENGISLENEKENKSENLVIAHGGSSGNELTGDGSSVTFNESVISNLQMQFEKVAAEVGLDKDDANSFDPPKITFKRAASKKRKKVRSVEGDTGGDAVAKSNDKSAKRVRFSIKNNLVWKPQSPLPPQSLRLPPSATPRGSALKKGIPPGPIRELPPATKRVKQPKKGRKGIKTISPAIKRLRKLKSLSI